VAGDWYFADLFRTYQSKKRKTQEDVRGRLEWGPGSLSNDTLGLASGVEASGEVLILAREAPALYGPLWSAVENDGRDSEASKLRRLRWAGRAEEEYIGDRRGLDELPSAFGVKVGSAVNLSEEVRLEKWESS
jgi:hypothetical protein